MRASLAVGIKRMAFVAIVALAINAQAAYVQWAYVDVGSSLYDGLGISMSDSLVCLIWDTGTYRADVLAAVANGTFTTSMAGVLDERTFVQRWIYYSTPDCDEMDWGTHSVFMLVLQGDYAVSGGDYDYYYSASVSTLKTPTETLPADFNLVNFSGPGSGFGSVPEPTTGFLLLSGCAALLLRRRLRHHTKLSHVTRI